MQVWSRPILGRLGIGGAASLSKYENPLGPHRAGHIVSRGHSFRGYSAIDSSHEFDTSFGEELREHAI